MFNGVMQKHTHSKKSGILMNVCTNSKSLVLNKNKMNEANSNNQLNITQTH